MRHINYTRNSTIFMACLNRYFSSKASFRQYEYMAISAEEMFRDPHYLKQYFITFAGVGKCSSPQVNWTFNENTYAGKGTSSSRIL
jgi:hypothetical protein